MFKFIVKLDWTILMCIKLINYCKHLNGVLCQWTFYCIDGTKLNIYPGLLKTLIQLIEAYLLYVVISWKIILNIAVSVR